MTTVHETLATVLARKWGVATTVNVNPAGNNVPTNVVTIMKNNPNRLAWILVNLGSTVILVAPLRAASATFGIQIPPNGGSIALLADEDFDMTGYEWTAISIGGGNQIFSIEVLTNPMGGGI
jgi:hypothetical protein